MPPVFLWILFACYGLIVVLAVRTLTGFVLDLLSGGKPSYLAAVRATLWLFAVFALQFILRREHGGFRLGVLAGLLIWEVVAWVQRRNVAEQPVSLSTAK